MHKRRMIIRLLTIVVAIGLTLTITGGTITVSILEQQQQNSTSNQTMTGIDNKNISLTAVNITETNATSIRDVLILPGATGLENMAYQPNPIKIKVGETIVWINNDLSIHTVTEGNPSINVVPANGFDSGLINPEETFKHTFDENGTIQYHCSLHPTMLGKVIVVS